MYAQQQDGGQGANQQGNGNGSDKAEPEGDVVDAEFEEVEKDKKAS